MIKAPPSKKVAIAKTIGRAARNFLRLLAFGLSWRCALYERQPKYRPSMGKRMTVTIRKKVGTVSKVHTTDRYPYFMRGLILFA